LARGGDVAFDGLLRQAQVLVGDYYDVALRDYDLHVSALARWRLAGLRPVGPAYPCR
jgi:hypothetical protein